MRFEATHQYKGIGFTESVTIFIYVDYSTYHSNNYRHVTLIFFNMKSIRCSDFDAESLQKSCLIIICNCVYPHSHKKQRYLRYTPMCHKPPYMQWTDVCAIDQFMWRTTAMDHGPLCAVYRLLCHRLRYMPWTTLHIRGPTYVLWTTLHAVDRLMCHGPTYASWTAFCDLNCLMRHENLQVYLQVHRCASTGISMCIRFIDQ